MRKEKRIHQRSPVAEVSSVEIDTLKLLQNGNNCEIVFLFLSFSHPILENRELFIPGHVFHIAS